MGRSQQTFSKTEREKKKAKKREEKLKKKEARKSEPSSGKLEDNLVYVDEFGNFTDTPPDPTQKVEIEAEDIVIGVPKMTDEEREEANKPNEGKVSFFDHSKGFGFIIDNVNQEKYFVHVSGVNGEITEGDSVKYELERGQRGMNAVNVEKI